jgi:hypothetical protein
MHVEEDGDPFNEFFCEEVRPEVEGNMRALWPELAPEAVFLIDFTLNLLCEGQ